MSTKLEAANNKLSSLDDILITQITNIQIKYK